MFEHYSLDDIRERWAQLSLRLSWLSRARKAIYESAVWHFTVSTTTFLSNGVSAGAQGIQKIYSSGVAFLKKLPGKLKAAPKNNVAPPTAEPAARPSFRFRSVASAILVAVGNRRNRLHHPAIEERSPLASLLDALGLITPTYTEPLPSEVSQMAFSHDGQYLAVLSCVHVHLVLVKPLLTSYSSTECKIFRTKVHWHAPSQ